MMLRNKNRLTESGQAVFFNGIMTFGVDRESAANYNDTNFLQPRKEIAMKQPVSYETYEFEARTPLERSEWDNIWFDQATNTQLPRVVVFGDSITVNYRFALVNKLKGEFCVDNYGTSKAADNPFLRETMRLILAQQNHDIIHFCSGHGTHQSAEEYEKNVDKLVCWLLETYPSKKLIISLRAYSDCLEFNKYSLERNVSLARIAQKYHLPVDDLYSVTEGRVELLKEDKIHLNDAGCEVVAAQAAETIRKVAADLYK